MATASTIIKALIDETERIAEEKDFVFPAGRDKTAKPDIYKYFYPLNLEHDKKNNPYIVVTFDEESQQLQTTVDKSTIELRLIVGICVDDSDVSAAIELLLAALERLEIEIKNIELLNDIAVLQKIKKQIPTEQPIPTYEGIINLEYSYYKPILIEEP